MNKHELIVLLQKAGKEAQDIKRIIVFSGGSVKIEFFVEGSRQVHNCIAEYNKIHLLERDIEELSQEVKVEKRE